MSKVSLGVLLILLFGTTVAFSLNMRAANADTQIVYINADGSITPSTAPITTFDNVTYTLIGDISSPTYNGIAVQKANVVIDGEGHTIQGGNSYSAYGVNVVSVDNVTIKNVDIRNCELGIQLLHSNTDTIFGNNITANYGNLELHYSSNDVISANNITAGGELGIDFNTWANNNIISDNNLTGDYVGINLWLYFSNNTITQNDVSADSICGIDLIGGCVSPSSGNIVSDNNLTADLVGIKLEGTGGDIVNTIISGNYAARCTYGIEICPYSSYNNTIE